MLSGKDMVDAGANRLAASSLVTKGREWFLESLSRAISSPVDSSQPGEGDSEVKIVSTEYLVYNWLESMFAWFQVVILWHEPRVSLCAISGLLSSFLLLTYFAPRFYATVLIAIFTYNFSRFWFRYLWPDIRVPPSEQREAEMILDVDRFTYLHPQLMTLAELNQQMSEIIEFCEDHLAKLLELRRRKPTAFCSLICSILSCTAYIGNRISGVSLIFCFLAIVFTGPGVYHHFFSESTKSRLRQGAIKLFQNIFHSDRDNGQQPSAADSQHNLEDEALQGSSIDSNDEKPKCPSESLVSSIAASTKTQAILLYEHIKRKSFTAGDADVSSSQAEGEIDAGDDPDDCKKSGQSSPVDPPQSRYQDNTVSTSAIYPRLVRQDHSEPAVTGEDRTNVDELAGNTPSLNDSDEEQQDGFVLL